MRAARLLDMLLLLNRRGRLAARELAASLEVSEPTILRDVEALSEAGVAVRTRRGSQGGIELMNGFETRLTGLRRDEAECLSTWFVHDPSPWGEGSCRAARSPAVPDASGDAIDRSSTWSTVHL